MLTSCGKVSQHARTRKTDYEVVLQLQLLERKKYLLEKQFQGKSCIGLHLDMLTNTDSVEGEQYTCVIMTTVVEPIDTTAPGAQLRLRNHQQARVKALRPRYHGQVL
jgi:hypothetical protein